MPTPIPPEPQPERLPLNAFEQTLLQSEVAEQIRTVFDPEIPVNVYDLGLIYDIQVQPNRDVHILMTLTSPNCPVAGSLPGEVQSAAQQTDGVGKVTLELTWDPPFGLERMSEEAKLALGFM